MPQGKGPGDEVCAREESPQSDAGRKPPHQDLDRTISDPESWGEPLSYVDLLTDRTVQSRIAKLIVQAAIKRPYRGR